MANSYCLVMVIGRIQFHAFHVGDPRDGNFVYEIDPRRNIRIRILRIRIRNRGSDEPDGGSEDFVLFGNGFRRILFQADFAIS